MKKTLIYIISVVLNIELYFFLQIIAPFVQFGLFDRGETIADKVTWVSLFFLFLQMITLMFLFKRGILIDMTLLILNELIMLILFLFAVL